ncbi:LPS export ABC transporter periplasmic protein LptC [Sphingorhabdus sp. IMCC26285]|uniref:LPS export ABC transporter periplasmic protein LptC n=1 Tax=Sphingorhabdus profundilacus TaxID=2509718 RepID=A0A6I4LYC5_9SPHN|nr:LPS export ABC transporter periplasmic protein LptC [Sphingorhabdus profundilacus]MVZ98567.1 LPS export ABC transporter periplasmic protein LptC [Sphingorhabdus profundilacus]
MSEQADLERTQRQQWALPGGRHDRLIVFLRIGLPSTIGILVAILAFSPFTGTQELSFVLNKDEVNLSRERMRLIEALYRGEDSKGRPFSLRAGSAVQKTSAEPILNMTALSARILLNDGPASILAQRGSYNLNRETMRITGPLAVNSTGYDMVASNVELSLKTKTMQSFGPVSGRTKVGTFRADRLNANLETRVVRLDGGVHLRINQNAVK